MTKDIRDTPQPHELDSLVQSINDWIADDRELISARRGLKRRFIVEMTAETGMRRIEAENLFEVLMHYRQAQVGLVNKSVRVSTRNYVYGSEDNLHGLCGINARRWEIGEHPPQHSYSPDLSARFFQKLLSTYENEAVRECSSCGFLPTEGQPELSSSAQRAEEK